MADTNVVEGPRPADADDVVRASVRALLGAAGLNQIQLAGLIGMPDATLNRRLKSRGPNQAFSAGELSRIAEVFHVPVGVLFDPPVGFPGPGGHPTVSWAESTAPASVLWTLIAPGVKGSGVKRATPSSGSFQVAS